MKTLALAAIALAALAASARAEDTTYLPPYSEGLIAYDNAHDIKVVLPTSCAAQPKGLVYCWTQEEQAKYWPCLYAGDNMSAGAMVAMNHLSQYISSGIGGQTYSDWYRSHNDPKMCAGYAPASPTADTQFTSMKDYANYIPATNDDPPAVRNARLAKLSKHAALRAAGAPGAGGLAAGAPRSGSRTQAADPALAASIADAAIAAATAADEPPRPKRRESGHN